jgi:hypothetical protein
VPIVARKVAQHILNPWLLLGVVLSLLAPLVVWQEPPQAEEAPAVATPSVSDAELERYIAVYKAMQADHGLNIEEAIRPHGVSLEEFRLLERRIQENPRLVEKVRNALLEFARANSAVALAASPTPTPGKAKPEGRRRK